MYININFSVKLSYSYIQIQALQNLYDYLLDNESKIETQQLPQYSRGTAQFLICKDHDYQQSLWKMVSSVS